MSEAFDEVGYFHRRPAGKTTVSQSFGGSTPETRLRIASQVIDGQEGLRSAVVQGETVLRATPAGRSEIKATFFEDDRTIKTLTIQRFSSSTGPHARQHFSFVGSEIDRLLEFIVGIKSVALDGPQRVYLSPDELRSLVLDQGQIRRLVESNSALVIKIAQSEELQRDIVATGYRRRQLRHFSKLLNEDGFFETERERAGLEPEKYWQTFFEKNTWIFGHGLSYQFLTSLDDRKLEQTVSGSDIGGPGKRVDGLMKTRGLISTLCYIELKRHDTLLLRKGDYRSGAWAPSTELSGAVAQLQTTVAEAIESLGRKHIPTSQAGDPTGESLFNIEPKSYVVAGNLSQFYSDAGLNETKFRSFERYRRSLHSPEIVTFDELFERARFIVEHTSEAEETNKHAGRQQQAAPTGTPQVAPLRSGLGSGRVSRSSAPELDDDVPF